MLSRTSFALVGALLTALALPHSASAVFVPSPQQWVVVIEEAVNGYDHVVAVKLDTRERMVVYPADGSYYEDAVVSPGGWHVAVSTNFGTTDPYAVGISVRSIADPAGPDGGQLTQAGSRTEDVYDTEPTWTPGGRIYFSRVTYTPGSAGYAASGELHSISSALGSLPRETRPTSLGIQGFQPDVDPTGTKLAYIAAGGDTTGSGPLVVARLDGQDVVPTPDAVGLDPDWSWDGSSIAMVLADDRGGPGPIGVLATDALGEGGIPAVLPATVQPGTYTRAPAWLPDSRSLVYTRVDRTDPQNYRSDLYAVDRRGVRSGPVLASARDEVFGSVAAQYEPTGPTTRIAGGPPSTYVPLTPRRIFDSRPESAVGTTSPGRVRGNLGRRIVGMPADTGTIPDTATAVVLNVTALGALWPTDVTVAPSGPTTANVETSSINVRPGQVVPNLVTSRLSSDGWVHFIVSSPTPPSDGRPVHLVVDLVGYYDSSDAGHRFQDSPPTRILETRAAQGGPVGLPTARRLGPGEVLDLTVRGALGIRGGGTVNVPQDAAAVVLNVTATGATVGTDVRVYPTGLPAVPTVSNVNVSRGGTSSNLVIAKVGADGRVRLRNSAGSVDLVADLAGWFSPSAPSLFVPATPIRALDTRFGTGAAPIRTTPGGFADLELRPAGRTLPVRALALNVTGVQSTSATDVRAYAPEVGAVPEVSNLNLRGGETRANAVLVGVGSSSVVRLRNAAGSVHLLADVVGWFEG